jgi:hypothetical protein
MAIHKIPILGASTLPDTTGNVYFEPVAVNLQSNDRYPGLCAVFADTSTRLKLGVGFVVPQNYVGTAKIGLIWAVTVTSGKVVWEFDYTAIANGETSDPSADQESTTSTGTTVNGTARILTVTEISLTSANLVAGDWVEGVIVRDGADTTNDTAAGSAYLLGAYFSYADA